MKRADINIEFAHIGFDADFDKEQIDYSARIAARTLSWWKKKGASCSVSILIDDKFVKHPITLQRDVVPFIEYARKSVDISYMCYETSLSKYKDEMFKLVKPEYRERVKSKILDYESKKGRIACSHDIAIWHLIRFGMIRTDVKTIVPLPTKGRKTLPPFEADRVVSILSAHDRKHEDAADKDILRHIEDNGLVRRIERIYFDPKDGKIIT